MGSLIIEAAGGGAGSKDDTGKETKDDSIGESVGKT
jgi:hypothetical protein